MDLSVQWSRDQSAGLTQYSQHLGPVGPSSTCERHRSLSANMSITVLRTIFLTIHNGASVLSMLIYGLRKFQADPPFVASCTRKTSNLSVSGTALSVAPQCLVGFSLPEPDPHDPQGLPTPTFNSLATLHPGSDCSISAIQLSRPFERTSVCASSSARSGRG
jgi:hypothetical protein